MRRNTKSVSLYWSPLSAKYDFFRHNKFFEKHSDSISGVKNNIPNDILPEIYLKKYVMLIKVYMTRN